MTLISPLKVRRLGMVVKIADAAGWRDYQHLSLLCRRSQLFVIQRVSVVVWQHTFYLYVFYVLPELFSFIFFIGCAHHLLTAAGFVKFWSASGGI